MKNNPIQHIALGVEYLGTRYHGFQKLPHTSQTIEQKLIKAISHIHQQYTPINAAGRTDAGVHANEQVIHFQHQKKRQLTDWIIGVNHYLPNDIKINWSAQVDPIFHARYSAKIRRYHYLIYHATFPNVFWDNRALFLPRPINLTLMNKAAQYLVGEHDFTSFRNTDCQAKNPIRTVYEAKFYINPNKLIVFDITANAFLYHMVRNILGTLLFVGQGKHPPEHIKWVLKQKNRCLAGPKIAPSGLYLHAVDYPKLLFLKRISRQPLAMLE